MGKRDAKFTWNLSVALRRKIRNLYLTLQPTKHCVEIIKIKRIRNNKNNNNKKMKREKRSMQIL